MLYLVPKILQNFVKFGVLGSWHNVAGVFKNDKAARLQFVS